MQSSSDYVVMEPEISMKVIIFISSLSVIAHSEVYPRGHLQSLGAHTEPDKIEELFGLPSPQEFWSRYVNVSKPVIFRGVGKESPLFLKWTDDYIKDNFGSLEVRIEAKKEKSGRVPRGARGVGRDTLSNFIETYHDFNSNKYVVSELPTPMYKDVFVPRCLGCGTLANSLVEIDLWMSGGGSSSILHKDAFNAINCLYNGTKEWKLIEYKYENKIYKAYEPEYEIGGFSRINPDKVDLLKYPKIAEVPWSSVTVNAGDCLFLPKSMYHQVKSYGSHNLAIAILFSRFDGWRNIGFKNCIDVKSRPLSEFDIDWQFPGYGEMTMGNIDLTFVRKTLRSLAKDVITRHSVAGLFEKLHLATLLDKDSRKTVVQDFFNIFGLSLNDEIHVSAIDSLSKDQLRKVALLLSPKEPSNSYDHEYSTITVQDIVNLVERLLRKGNLTRDSFITAYINTLEGTEEFANRLFDDLGGTVKDNVSKELLVTNFKEALTPYIMRQRLRIPTPEGEDAHGDAYEAKSNTGHDQQNDNDRNDDIYNELAGLLKESVNENTPKEIIHDVPSNKEEL